MEDVSRSLAAIKTTLYGSSGEDASAEVSTQLSQEICSGQLLQQLIENLGRIDFEVYKHFIAQYHVAVLIADVLSTPVSLHIYRQLHCNVYKCSVFE